MRRLRKVPAVFLVFCLLCSMVPGIGQVALADSAPVIVYVDSYSAGTLAIHWDSLPGIQSVRVIYHTPAGDRDDYFDQTANTRTISGLQNNTIYDIDIKIYDNTSHDGSGQIGEGFLYFLPRMTFNAARVEQAYETIAGGGRETGTKPQLQLKWTVPKVYDSGAFVYANDPAVLSRMANRLNLVYSDGRQVSSLNFRINISTDLSRLNSGSSQSALLIDYDPVANYSARVSGSDSVTSSVYGIDAGGNLSFNILGKKDSTVNLTGADGDTYLLPDNDILPGTVYYMNVKPVFRNSSGDSVNLIKVGAPSDQNGSILSGTVPYTYTPIRFQLSKDSANNIYVKVFRINQGTLDMPEFYYQVQASDDPAASGEWPVKATMSDRFFPPGSQYAVMIFPVVNVNNLIYYRVVARTDSSSDRLESLKMPYTLSVDISRPPVPSGVSAVSETPVSRDIADPVTGQTVTQNSNDVKISWDKPLNWTSIKNNLANDIYFHILLSTNQTDLNTSPYPPLESMGKTYGNFAVKYRLIKYVSANSANITENGDHLEYTIKGFDLFKGEESDGISDDVIPNADGYPAFLLPNKTYYIQMYTTMAVDRGSTDPAKMSDKSAAASFTTITGTSMDVPLPRNFRVNRNDADVTRDPLTGQVTSTSNFIELQFDKVNVDWTSYAPDTGVTKAVYYDLYMSTGASADSFIRIGTTDTAGGDVSFAGTDLQSTYIKASVRNFSTANIAAYNAFGSKLMPNTKYYFTVRTRLVIQKALPETRMSDATPVLPVTTIAGTLQPPDESGKKPLAPADFDIAKDQAGNSILTGTMVAFSWMRQESGVTYTIMCTSVKPVADAQPSAYADDPVYKSFNARFGKLVLDPAAAPLANNFEYNTATKVCKYTINQWISPNKLYYFSIRAEKASAGSSVWITIPVTTGSMDAPEALETVKNPELGIFWTDDNPALDTDDFRIYIKGPKDSGYGPAPRTQTSIVKDGSVYYGRIANLQSDCAYGIKVTKTGSGGGIPVFEKAGLKTRNTLNSLEVRWKGIAGYRYELAVKAAKDSGYTTVTDMDMQGYVDRNGNVLPYYPEKTLLTVGTAYSYCYARIKTVKVTLSDGTAVHQPLRSDTKYYIKVRAVRIDPVDSTMVSYSSYVGPADMRTDFDQAEYDRISRDTDKKNMLADKIGRLEETLCWDAGAGQAEANVLLLKSDMALNIVHNETGHTVTLDIAAGSKDAGRNELYIPVGVIRMLNDEDKSLVIETDGAEFTIRPGALDVDSMDEITYLRSRQDIKDIMFKLAVSRSSIGAGSIPDGYVPLTGMYELNLKAVGVSMTDDKLKALLYDRLYNTDTGLVKQKLDILDSALRVDGTDAANGLEDFTDVLVNEIRNDISGYIGGMLTGSGASPSIVIDVRDIEAFNVPISVNIACAEGKERAVPFISWDTNSWRKAAAQTTDRSSASPAFDAARTGRYVLLAAKGVPADASADYQGKKVFEDFNLKYGLDDIFGKDVLQNPGNSVTVREMILLYERLAGNPGEPEGESLVKKIRDLRLEDIVSLDRTAGNITRQEAAALMIRLYSDKLGMDPAGLKPKRNIAIADESKIDKRYYNQVLMSVDLGILSLDNGSFAPLKVVKRVDAADAFTKLLKLTGDL